MSMMCSRDDGLCLVRKHEVVTVIAGRQPQKHYSTQSTVLRNFPSATPTVPDIPAMLESTRSFHPPDSSRAPAASPILHPPTTLIHTDNRPKKQRYSHSPIPESGSDEFRTPIVCSEEGLRAVQHSEKAMRQGGATMWKLFQVCD